MPLYDHFTDKIKNVKIFRDLNEESPEMPKVIKELEEEEKTFDEQTPTTTKGNIFGIASSISSGQDLGMVNTSDHDNKGDNHTSNSRPNLQKSVVIEGARVLLDGKNSEFIKEMKRLNRYDIVSLEKFLFYGADSKDISFNTQKTLIKIYNMKMKLRSFRKIVEKNTKNNSNASKNSSEQMALNVNTQNPQAQTPIKTLSSSIQTMTNNQRRSSSSNNQSQNLQKK